MIWSCWSRDVDKWQAKIDQETKDEGDKETGADYKDIAEFIAAWLELMATQKIVQDNPLKKKPRHCPALPPPPAL